MNEKKNIEISVAGEKNHRNNNTTEHKTAAVRTLTAHFVINKLDEMVKWANAKR